jgi:hypothetical protein
MGHLLLLMQEIVRYGDNIPNELSQRLDLPLHGKANRRLRLFI